MKKKFLLTSLVLLTLTSCLPAGESRKTRDGNSENITPNMFSTTTPSYQPTGTTIPDNTNSVTADNFLTIPNGAVNCYWSRDGQSDWKYKASHLSASENDLNDGMYNICVSATNPKMIYFQMKHPPSDHQICFVPTSNDGNLKTYLGEARCESVTSANRIYDVELLTNRPGYQNATITGVMIMRDKAYFYAPPFNQLILSPDAFIYCNQWLAAYRDPSYCESFANGSHYEYHQFSTTP